MSSNSEFALITKSKDLCTYILTVTQNSPKKFRFTLTSRIQNLSLDILQTIFKANEIRLSNNSLCRLEFQREALISLKMLSFICNLATEQKCILVKQFEHISSLIHDCQYLILAWIKSDSKRKF